MVSRLASILFLAAVAISEVSAEAPPTIYVPPIYDCASIVALADMFAIDVLGYADENENGVPDYRERFILNEHDCASISATFDEILRLMGQAGILNPDQAAGACQIRGGDHAANLVPGCGYVDVTPISNGVDFVPSNGQPWYDFPPGSHLVPDGYPDQGEAVDPAYTGPFGPPTEPAEPPSIEPTTPGIPHPPTVSPPSNPCRGIRSLRCRRWFRRVWSR